MLIDGGSSLNILYVETLDAMGVSWSKLLPSLFPFYGIVPGMKAYPLENNDLPVTVGVRDNFHTETLIFEVVTGRARTMQSSFAHATRSSW